MIKIFRIIGFLEGLSYLFLLGVAMPVKYIMNEPTFMKYPGWIHGLLFVAYLLGAFIIFQKYDWKAKTFIIVLLGSILPFGTFYTDKKYLKDLDNEMAIKEL